MCTDHKMQADVRNPLIVALLSDEIAVFRELAEDAPETALELCLKADHSQCLEAIWRLVPSIQDIRGRLKRPDTTFLAVMKGAVSYAEAEEILGVSNIFKILLNKLDVPSSSVVRFFSLGDEDSTLATTKLFEEAGAEDQICLARCATSWPSGGAELLEFENLELPALQVLCLAAAQKNRWRRSEWRRAEAKSSSEFLKAFCRMFFCQ